MVIADNDTRWNSIYLSILRGLKLKHKIQVYSLDERASLGSNYLEESDWKSLQEIADCLEPFYPMYSRAPRGMRRLLSMG